MSYTLGTPLKKYGTSGGHSIRSYKVSPDAATGDVTISDVDKVYVLGVVPLAEDPAANAQVAVQALQDSTTLNKINIKLWQATNSAASTNFKDFLLTVLCEH